MPTHVADRGSVLAKLGVRADVIYVDGSRAYEGVMADLRAYWALLTGRGVLMGDDYHPWWDVERAVEDFSAEVGVPSESFADAGWLMRRDRVREAVARYLRSNPTRR